MNGFHCFSVKLLATFGFEVRSKLTFVSKIELADFDLFACCRYGELS